jgi:hypothetical protein
MTYLQNQISFDEKVLKATAKSAVDYLKQKADKSYTKLTGDQFVADLRESVCLLQADGLNTSFVHRSFQEYFTSLFATSIHPSQLRPLLDQCSERFSDSVLRMALDMDRDTVEKEWVMPTLQHLSAELRLEDNGCGLSQRLAAMVNEIQFLRYHDGNCSRVLTHFGHVSSVATLLGAVGLLYNLHIPHPLDRSSWVGGDLERALKPEHAERLHFRN